MVFTFDIRVYGGVRGANGAVAAVFHYTNKPTEIWLKRLSANPRPKNLRAELAAIAFALDQVLVQHRALNRNPRVNVTITTDSRHAFECLTVHHQRWLENGWVNAKGTEVANRDVIEEALRLEDEIWKMGTVKYGCVSRAENTNAEEAVNEELGRIEKMGEEGSRDML